MAIETLEDYNAQAACCCPQLLCPIPEEIVQSAKGSAGVAYYFGNMTDNAGTRFKKQVRTYEDCTFEETETLAGHHDFAFPDGTDQLDNSDLTITDNGVGTGGCGNAIPPIKSEGISWEDWIADAESALDENFEPLDALDDWSEEDWMTEGGGFAHIKSDTEYVSGLLDNSFSYEKQWARVGWQIPATWLDLVAGEVAYPGTYFLIGFNVLEEVFDPADLSTPVSQTFIDNPAAGGGDDPKEWAVEWIGPGSGDADDPSWRTEFVKIPPPSGTGYIFRRIVNRRLVCRENWGIGDLPQVWGEAVELPEP